ncbi:MAG TPA: hypothetical protein VME69_02220 [Methylocella sp.]|nr:hypothetical protein [Methylocella sp.]
MLVEGGFPITWKTGFGIIGGILGGIAGAAADGVIFGLTTGVAAGLSGVLIGSFCDHDFGEPIMYQSVKNERAWARVGYGVLSGLAIAVLGIILLAFVPDWRPLLFAAIGMLVVVVALAYGETLDHRRI